MIYVGIDPAASTGIAVVGAEPRAFEGSSDDMVAMIRRDFMAVGVPIGTDVRVAVELPFVGDNKKGAMKQAITAGRLAEAACHAYGVPFEEVLWLEPMRWRKEIGCPLGKLEAKEWCWRKAKEAGLEVETKRGRKLYDAAEAYGIALAARSMQRRLDAAREPG